MKMEEKERNRGITMKPLQTEDVILDSYESNKDRPLKTLFAMYKGNYYKFVMSAFFYVIKHSPSWIMPIIVANIINCITYQERNALNTIFLNSAVIMTLLLLNVPMNYLHVRFGSRVIRFVEAGLRSALVRKLQQLSISYHKDVQSGRIQSKVMRDVEAVEALSSQLFVGLLNVLINIAVALGITAFKNKVVFVFFLLTIPVAALTIVMFRNKIKNQNHRFRKEVEVTSAKIIEMEEMIPVTRAHALEKLEVQRMQAQVRNVAEEGYRLDIIQANFGSVSWAVFQAFQVGCLVFTGILAMNSNIQAGDIVLYQSYFTTIIAQVSSLITLMPTMAKGLESVSSIGEVLNAHDVEDNRGKRKIENLEGNFEFKGVEFQYNNSVNKVLDGLNLKVKAGETIALVGESGAGKSTALNLLIGFVEPTQGVLLVDGLDLKKINLRSYRKHIAVVPQNTILFSGSIRDNITYGLPTVNQTQLAEAIEAANLTDLIVSLPEGLDTLIGEHGNKLSGGQRQRISIARAIIRDPKVIIFDEATSALDSVSEKLILDALDNLIKGRTTFIVAHRLSTIRKADKICVVRDGMCTEFGTYEELMALKGEFYRMKTLQS
ncbi:MAG: ABC-type multidrug transport system, ATPase and permease component [Herbinix sp.]|jgi:ATP-binding cassette subfamily B protein|nr:ABC-type multidrug transport system, ATPase and permease component [Herbinix sp.]